MLEVTSLSKSFDGFKAVKNASLSVKDGEVVAVIGPNGAGKTTLFNLITGVIKPDSGKVIFKGEDITGLKPFEVCRRGMSRSFQVVNVFPRLSVFENVQVSVLSRQKKTWNLFTPSSRLAIAETEKILENVGLTDVGDATSTAL
ncbi:ATP-binding cassette domain-containing protein, partial [bacterium]|nr:ATP-binding cassette domain-containing protein [bacterium]